MMLQHLLSYGPNKGSVDDEGGYLTNITGFIVPVGTFGSDKMLLNTPSTHRVVRE